MRKLWLLTLLTLTSLVSVHAQVYGPYACSKTAIATTTSSGTTAILAADQRSIRICNVYIQVVQPGSAPANFGLVSGTGLACATGQANVTGQWLGVANSTQSFTQVTAPNVATFVGGGNGLCLKLSTAPTGAVVQVTYEYY